MSDHERELHSSLRTVEQALKCAIKLNDWMIVYESIVLLQQAIARVTALHVVKG